MKYIIIKASWNSEEEALLFPESLIHKEVAIVTRVMDRYELISAGFCDGNFNVYGESTSLNLHSREEDEAILRMNFYEIRPNS